MEIPYNDYSINQIKEGLNLILETYYQDFIKNGKDVQPCRLETTGYSINQFYDYLGNIQSVDIRDFLDDCDYLTNLNLVSKELLISTLVNYLPNYPLTKVSEYTMELLKEFCKIDVLDEFALLSFPKEIICQIFLAAASFQMREYRNIDKHFMFDQLFQNYFEDIDKVYSRLINLPSVVLYAILNQVYTKCLQSSKYDIVLDCLDNLQELFFGSEKSLACLTFRERLNQKREKQDEFIPTRFNRGDILHSNRLSVSQQSLRL